MSKFRVSYAEISSSYVELSSYLDEISSSYVEISRY